MRPRPRAACALRLLAADPAGLGGLWLRARAGPVRDAVLAALAALPLPVIRLHPAMEREALDGGSIWPPRWPGADGAREGRAGAAFGAGADHGRTLPAGLAGSAGAGAGCGGSALIALDEGAEGRRACPGADRPAGAVS
jgi:magnesium chelatase subunit D